MLIARNIHPNYKLQFDEYFKWRLTYESGRLFINHYLKRYSRRETPQDYDDRKEVTYCPAFAKAAINKVKNSLYERFSEIKRLEGSQSYIDACLGLNGGVDLHGRSMNMFMGQLILPELLPMSKVGIYVDMPELSGDTMIQTQNARPYLYYYRPEDIQNWAMDYENYYTKLILRDTVLEYDDTTGMPIGETINYRSMWQTSKGVMVEYYDNNSNKFNEILLNLPRIPFVVVELHESLLKDIADYQIALLNMASSDISYVLKSNFPFYTEQGNMATENQYGKKDTASGEDPKEIKVGTSSGRKYPIGADRPGFIHPSPEPLKASMEKQAQLKDEIYLLLDIALTNVQPKFASAESKALDKGSLETGLAYIGLELEFAENRIAEFWYNYEKIDQAVVKYPEKYSVTSNFEIQAKVDQLTKLIKLIPSKEYRKVVMKKIADLTVGYDITYDDLQVINNDIDGLQYITADPLDLQIDIEAGLVSLETASKARGYGPGEVEQAKKDNLEKIKAIAAAQAPGVGAGARGLPAASPTPAKDAKEEKVTSNGSVNA